MLVNELIDLIRSTILYNIDLGTIAEIEVRRNKQKIGYISGSKNSEFKVILHDSKLTRNKFKVIDLLSLLNRSRSRGRSEKEVVYATHPGCEYDIKSVYFKLERSGYSVKFIKFYVNVL